MVMGKPIPPVTAVEQRAVFVYQMESHQ